MANSRVDINRLKDTSYEVIISVLISDDDITTQSTLDCELKIPDTPYVKRKTFVFFQGELFFFFQPTASTYAPTCTGCGRHDIVLLLCKATRFRVMNTTNKVTTKPRNTSPNVFWIPRRKPDRWKTCVRIYFVWPVNF